MGATQHEQAAIQLTLTPAAAEQVRKVIEAEQAPAATAGLRVGVMPGGCSGFKYALADGSWLLIRFSGTEPIMRFYAEADSPSRVGELIQAGRELAEA